MNGVKKYLSLVICLAPFGWFSSTAFADALVGDAYAREAAGRDRWVIGTDAVEQVFEVRDGQFRLAGYKNKLGGLAKEYVNPETAGAPFALDVSPFAGRSPVEPVWSKPLKTGATVDPAGDNVGLAVKKGDLIGFSALSPGDAKETCLEWSGTVAYQDGESFTSSDEREVDQGPHWFYYWQPAGSGNLELLSATAEMDSVSGRKVRLPSGHRSPLESPTLNGRHFSLKNAHTETYSLLRVWKAPVDGVVKISGPARIILGNGCMVSVVRIRRNNEIVSRLPGDFSRWLVDRAETSEVNAGGRPAVQLALDLKREALRARLRVVAYPGTSVLRQWVTLENTGPTTINLKAPAPLTLSLSGADADAFTNLWMVGGNSKPTAGVLRSAPVGDNYHRILRGRATDNYVSWMALQRRTADADGWFVALDYLGFWNMGFDHDAGGPAILSVSLPALTDHALHPGGRLEMPVVTTGTYHRNLDDMGTRLYNWQYEYMWDYTNPDYYAKPMWITPWFFCSRNLQEQFTARLGELGMDADIAQMMGFGMLWDDAGWSKYPFWPIPDNYGNVFKPTYEGPDFARTLRYYGKIDLKWILWFAGRPSGGLMDTKVGSWGDFQFRTDAVGQFDLAADQAYRRQIEGFLTRNPGSSFHTCNGGSRYSHQFEIQRLADVNYFSDLGRGPETNYYMSYLDAPDKWVDVLEPLLNAGARYNPRTSRGHLTMVPCWYAFLAEEDRMPLRKDIELYHYLLREGVAGRWSYLFHPIVTGDAEFYYMQRTSHDRKRACIILKHQAQGDVLIQPVELLPDHEYAVGFDSIAAITKRTGTDLMQNGILLKNQKPGELIFLGLPGRPGGGTDRTPPTAPGNVLTRRETNLGHSGVSVYWSSGADDNWVRGYRISRDGRQLGEVRRGLSYFDHSAGWDPQAEYAVQTIDGDDNASEWTVAQPLADEPLTADALGGHFAEAGRDGWSAEASFDSRVFSTMVWVPPAKSPGGDFGGTPNQAGGVEGYWEDEGGARVGRGWQQASAAALSIRTWTAPVPGTVRVTGRAIKDAYRQSMGNGLRVRILLNTDPVWPATGWAQVPLDDLTGVTHDLTLKIAKGDKVRFVLDRDDQVEDAILAWMPRLVYQEQTESRPEASVVRLWCGSDKDYVDQTGQRWWSDRYYQGGQPYATTAAIANASPTSADTSLYQAGRRGDDFTYSIPVKPGLYSVRLKLAEPEHDWFFQRPFNLSVNGAPVLNNHDVCWASRGPRRAHEKILRYLVPNREGRIELHFTAGWEPVAGSSGTALVQAMEVLPEATSDKTVRINVGSPREFVDWNGFVWAADDAVRLGESLTAGADVAVAQASPTLYDQALYRTSRTGRVIRLQAKVAPGLYTVHLKFAELWLAKPGQRPMHILINGKLWWSGWDPATAAGQTGMAAELRARSVTPDDEDRIVVELRAAGENDAILQGLVID